MKTRIISGAVALVLLAGVILLRGTVIFNIAFGLIGALMVYELFRAEKLDKEYALTAVSAAFALIAPVLVRYYPSEGGLSAVAVPYIIAAFAYIVTVTALLLARHKTVPAHSFYLCAAYTGLISLCMSAICGTTRLFDAKSSLFFLIFTFMGSWVADSGAYFAGTLFGKHKLCPEISPKKTVEGLIGGAVTNAAAFAILAAVLNRFCEGISLDIVIFAAVGVICCLLGLVGDLAASLIKRECGIKDYGNIMPGHGGAMDRFDSVVYVAPFMFAVFVLVG